MHATATIHDFPESPLSDHALGAILANTGADLASADSCRAALIAEGHNPQTFQGRLLAVRIEAHNYRAARLHMRQSLRQYLLAALVFITISMSIMAGFVEVIRDLQG